MPEWELFPPKHLFCPVCFYKRVTPLTSLPVPLGLEPSPLLTASFQATVPAPPWPLCVTAHQGVVHVRPRCCAVVQFLMASKAEDCFPQPRSWRPLGGTAPGDQTPEGTAHNFGPFCLVEAGQWVWSTLKRRGSHSGVNTGSRKPQGHLVLYKLGFI